MEYTCEYCQKSFNNLAGKYAHKEKEHKSPSIVFVNHNTHENPSELPQNIPIHSSDNDEDESSGDDDNLINIPRKRKAHGDHGADSSVPKRLRPDNGTQTPGALSNSTKDYRRLYLKSLKEFKKINVKYTSLQEKHKKMERDCDEKLMEKLDEKDLQHQADVDSLLAEYKKLLDDAEASHQTKIEKLERECENRVEGLNKRVVDLKDGGYTNFNVLSKAIFNCVTIQDIHKIRDLVNSQNVGEISTKHIDTIQKIMLGLSVGVIPICNPQRTVISSSQHKLITELQNAPPSAAKRKLKDNHSKFTRLWSIIDDSLGLICKTYNRYGSRDEDDEDL